MLCVSVYFHTQSLSFLCRPVFAHYQLMRLSSFSLEPKLFKRPTKTVWVCRLTWLYCLSLLWALEFVIKHNYNNIQLKADPVHKRKTLFGVLAKLWRIQRKWGSLNMLVYYLFLLFTGFLNLSCGVREDPSLFNSTCFLLMQIWTCKTLQNGIKACEWSILDKFSGM